MSYPARVLVALGLAAALLLLWQVRHVLLLVFGGFVFGAMFSAAGGLVSRLTGLRQRWGVVLGFLLVLLLLLGAAWWVGGAVAAQLDDLRDRVPAAGRSVVAWLNVYPVGAQLVELWQDLMADGVPLSRVVSAAGLTLSALGTTILMVMVGLFLAVEPGLYRRGTLRLLPPGRREAVGSALDCCAVSLRLWLRGQAISMLFVGVATGIGLALLDVPLALTLALLAFLLDFVPFFGPVVAGVLAVLVAFTVSPQVALSVAVLALAIQQLEGNVLLPLVQRWSVSLPPVLGLVAVVAFGSLFGLLGVLFATPLMVTLMVLVRELHVKRLEAGASGARM
jgi:predicted PurR-regulated permease PerM